MHTHADITSRIGALELGAIVTATDAALEAIADPGPPATRAHPVLPICRHIGVATPDDAALETALNAGPQTFPPACRRIDDGALERLSSSIGHPTSGGPVTCGMRSLMPMYCGRIDAQGPEAQGPEEDGTLERFAGPGGGPNPFGPPTLNMLNPACRHIEDEALEYSATSEPMVTRMLSDPRCHHVDDGALEASTRDASMGYTRAVSPVTRCV
jgi:hypothetical protein